MTQNQVSHSFRLGLKLYSTNTDLIPDASRLWEENICHYIELYTIPETYEKTVDLWRNCRIPFVIHAPHSVHGINLALAGQWEKNKDRFMEAQRFANNLHAKVIIVHGGHTGTIDETIRQIERLKDHRICLENKPKVGLNNEKCVGWSPREFQVVLDSGVLKVGIVLDFGHAACAAFSLGIPPMELVEEFLVFQPGLFHLSDGHVDSEWDEHLNIGKGQFNIADFLSVIPENGLLTLETPRDPKNRIGDFTQDVHSLSKSYVLRN